MRFVRDDPGARRVGTIDIETTHFDPTQGETVSIGLCIHDRKRDGDAVDYELLHRDGRGERRLIERASERLRSLDLDVLVSYNGIGFDLSFLSDRLATVGDPSSSGIEVPVEHIDLFADRKRMADRTGKKWPKLEECLAAYGIAEPRTIWKGRPVTNKRFGQELGPAYLQAVSNGNERRTAELAAVIDHYLRTDLEANLAVFYSDIGVDFTPVNLHNVGRFG